MKIVDLTDWPNGEIVVGLVSDTHGFVDPRIVEVLSNKCDVVAHMGDIGGQDVLEELRQATGRVYAVVGNNDVSWKWRSEEVGALEAISNKCTLKLPGGDLPMEHGHEVRDSKRYHELLRKAHPDVRAIAYGHTHVRVFDQTEVPWVLNPGAAGSERTKGGPSMQILTASDNSWVVESTVFETSPQN